MSVCFAGAPRGLPAKTLVAPDRSSIGPAVVAAVRIDERQAYRTRACRAALGSGPFACPHAARRA